MASARELRRQQREEEGAADEAEGAEEGPGPPRADLSPSSSFREQRAARGSTFSLWQDIPDVRGSGVLATLSLRDCKLQEVRPGRGLILWKMVWRFLKKLGITRKLTLPYVK